MSTRTNTVRLSIDGKEVKDTIADMDRAARKLQTTLKNLEPNDPKVKEYSEKLEIARKRATEIKEEMGIIRKRTEEVAEAGEKVKKTGGGMASTFKAVGAALGAAFAVDQIIAYGKELFNLKVQLSDLMADVRKTTGMTQEEVEKFTESLKEVDTRTSLSDLLGIAKVGGQIGIAKDQLDAFTVSVDKAVVALGDEFSGGAEEVAKQLGSIQKLFKETEKMTAAESIERVGSALNALGSSGSATAPVVADFTQRIGQLGQMAPSITQTLGLGAAMEELGLSAEIAAGGLTNVFLNAGKESAAFAQQLGMSEKAFIDLLNSDPNEMLLKLGESLQGLETDEVVRALDNMKIGSQESIKALTLLANKTDFIREKQKLAADEMAKATSLQDEFTVKNTNLAAQVEKAQKAITFFGMAIFDGVFTQVSKLIAPFESLIDTVVDFGRQIGLIGEETTATSAAVELFSMAINVLLVPVKLLADGFTLLIKFWGWMYKNIPPITAFVDAAAASVKGLFRVMQAGAEFFGFGNAAEEAKKNTDSIKKDVDEVKKETEKAAKDLTETEKKEAEKQKREAENKKRAAILAAQQRAEEEKKLADERAKVEANLLRQLAELQVASIEDATAREIAKAKLDAANRIKDVNDSVASAATKAKLVAAIEQQLDQQLATIEKERIERAAKAAQEIAKAQAATGLTIANIQLIEAGDDPEKQISAYRKIYEARLKVNKEAMNAELAEAKDNEIMQAEIRERFRLADLEAEEAYFDKLLEITDEANERRAASDQRLRDQQLQFSQEMLAATGATLGATADLLAQDEEMRKKYANEIKALKIAEIGVGLAAEIQNIWQYANANPLNSLFPGAAQVIAGAKTAAAVLRAGTAVANIRKQTFAEGGLLRGPSHAQGGIPFSVRGSSAAFEAEGDEFFTRRAATRNNLGALETINRFGDRYRFSVVPVMKLASGGMPLMQSPSTSALRDRAASPTLSPDFSPVVAELAALRAEVGAWNTNLTVGLYYTDLEDMAGKVAKVRA